MDLHHSIESPLPAEDASMPPRAAQAGLSSLIDPSTIVVQGDAEDQPAAAHDCEDMISGDDTQSQDSDPEIDDGGSDYLPTEVQGGESSDDDVPSSRKKHSKKINVTNVDIEELHEEWAHWEDIYVDLLDKKNTKALTMSQKKDLDYSYKRLQEMFEEIPASDPLRQEYARVLDRAQPALPSETRKRKDDAMSTAQNKKARLDQPRQSHPSTSAVPQMTNLRAAKEDASFQVKTQLQNFQQQGSQAGLDSKRLKSEVNNMENALAAFGESLIITAKDGCWLIRGMKTPLYSYQFDGAGWAVRRERTHFNSDNPRGGILADEMGCGKTITMLAVLMAKPAPKTYRVKANLLLVQSTQMATQWQKQIRKHCDKRSLAACCYSRKSGFNAASLATEQVIIMTYTEIQRAWGKIQGTPRRQRNAVTKYESSDDDEDDDDLDDTDQEKLLFNSEFHRLILDECQFIKSHNSKTAKAVFQLKSRIQWLISATPAPNNLEEYYPYLKVLKLQYTGSIGEFRRYWLDGKAKNGRDNLEVGLEKFQLRRTHETKIVGTRIFENVPNSVSEERIVTMSEGERAIYDAVVAPVQEEQEKLAALIKEQQQVLAAKGSKALDGDVMRKSKRAEAKILQLHKLTAHPFLLETIMQNKDFPANQVMKIRGMMKRLRESPLLDQAEDVFAKVGALGYGRSSSVDTQSLVSAPTSRGEGEEVSMHLQTDYTSGENAAERRCHICPGEKIPIEAILSECGHAFCKTHFDNVIQLSRMVGPEHPDSCTVCQRLIGTAREVDQTEIAAARAAFLAEASTGRGFSKSKQKGEKRDKKRGDDFNGHQPRGMRSVWLADSDRSHPKVPLLQSSKTRAVLDTIDRWQDDAPDDKIIIFTQWVMLGKVLGRSLQDKGINFLYYFGEFSVAERKKNLQTFEREKDVKVIIMGFKCAGQGLDMPYANRVILVDPWWNEDGELQAFARVKRKVQKKTTFFLRLMAKDTIDMRIGDIKESKREMTLRMRKEDDPLRRSEIALEYALKSCNMQLSANPTKNEDPEQDEADQKDEIDPNAESVQEEEEDEEDGSNAAIEA